MKVLFANNICGHFGGVEQVVLHAARGLRGRGHECFLAYGVAGRDMQEYAQSFDGVFRCTEFGTDERAGATFAHIVNACAPDTVFYHKVTCLPPGGERIDGVRTVRMQHDADLFCPTGLGYFRHGRSVCHVPAGWPCWCDLAFLGRSTRGRFPIRWVSVPAKLREMRRNRRIDAILAISTFVRDKLVSNGFPPERVHLCHPILDLEVPDPGPVPDENRVLFVGALLRGKGVDLLLRALSLVKTSFRATIIGAGKSEEKLRRLCAGLGLQDRVAFRGWVSPQAIGAEYAAAKVVAVPSRGPECFGLVGLEAMRYGRPVVAFAVGGIPDWLEHERTGLLVPEQDINAFAESLDRLLTDTGYARQLGENAGKRVQERFSFEAYLDKIEGFLQGEDESGDSTKSPGVAS